MLTPGQLADFQCLSPICLPATWIPEQDGQAVAFAHSLPGASQELPGSAEAAERGPTLGPFLGRAPHFHSCVYSELAQSYLCALCAVPVL